MKPMTTVKTKMEPEATETASEAIPTVPALLLRKSTVMAVLLLLSVGIGLASVIPFSGFSRPSSTDSIERAKAHWQAISAAPRPAGSTGHEIARHYIISEITRLGIPVEQQQVQMAFQQASGNLYSGTVKNILATVQGEGAGGTVLVSAHYDSAPNSPG